ncbi:hypothetical protein MNV_740036 [Candidatus Methanoperedens nitroreducens]|uniref:Uncharacterized protein n=1 Tax=Candidatus Methanoperedens nitratireducens TaxID=1392998 RepID=A0A284VT74_9EURY|nr:hypothetical protein MNV_740036 [Candidatus Methanoperedens nitroreducens]
MLTRIITEGATKVEVPVPDVTSSFPPSAAAVFYNPAMRINRDIAVAAIACFRKIILSTRILMPSPPLESGGFA